MRVLILAPYAPYPPHGGGTMRIYQLLRGLARTHDVTCLTFAEDASAEAALAPLHAVCRVIAVRGPAPRSLARRALTTLGTTLPDMALRNASADYWTALRDLLARERFDAVQAESIEMAQYLDAVPAGALRVLDQFNVEYVIQRRAALTALQALRRPSRQLPRHAAAAGYSLLQWAKLQRYERRVLRTCDLALAVSAADARIFQAMTSGIPVGVVPNGVDTDEFDRAALVTSIALQPDSVVFSGTMDYRPNVDAALWFADAVLPLIRQARPAARLVVVGKRPAPQLLARHGGDVTVLGAVPDVRPIVAAAAAYVVPMRIGGGVRLKLLEALALAAPVVSTQMGAEGVEGLTDGVHALLADTPDALAAAVLRLLADQGLGQRLGAAGRALVRQRYDWGVITPELEALYATHLRKEPHHKDAKRAKPREERM